MVIYFILIVKQTVHNIQMKSVNVKFFLHFVRIILLLKILFGDKIVCEKIENDKTQDLLLKRLLKFNQKLQV